TQLLPTALHRSQLHSMITRSAVLPIVTGISATASARTRQRQISCSLTIPLAQTLLPSPSAARLVPTPSPVPIYPLCCRHTIISLPTASPSLWKGVRTMPSTRAKPLPQNSAFVTLAPCLQPILSLRFSPEAEFPLPAPHKTSA